ncbi:SAM-dependent MidA family methyltransferase [Kutzneria viridogrisea]|uniref:SAM-dependent MidA family methyltransferase n=1 Tax=Kutzneria viridogrisea TaxID=47990 RepID=A0ABR6BN11_9PSEU|nr:SAM-dependent MidA family methyltransferase [Kutzneria viridogrisea]
MGFNTGMWLSWREATQAALYGETGFFLRNSPAQHFRTSVHASPLFAGAVSRLLHEVDLALGEPDPLDVVDLGAGRAELLCGLAALAPGGLADRLRLTAVELAHRPEGLPAEIGWRRDVPQGITGLVIANEWLDNVPVDLVELTGQGPRLVLVDPVSGEQRLGGPPSAADLDWLARWWPLTGVGDRAEVGAPRDAAWAEVVRNMSRGVAVAVDYAHLRGARPAGGTLTGYRDGRQVRPVPDGATDITAHVALDACAAAAPGRSFLTTQRVALGALGVVSEPPSAQLAATDPAAYLRELASAGEAAELLDEYGLGGFGWLTQFVATFPKLPYRMTQ